MAEIAELIWQRHSLRLATFRLAVTTFGFGCRAIRNLGSLVPCSSPDVQTLRSQSRYLVAGPALRNICIGISAFVVVITSQVHGLGTEPSLGNICIWVSTFVIIVASEIHWLVAKSTLWYISIRITTLVIVIALLMNIDSVMNIRIGVATLVVIGSYLERRLAKASELVKASGDTSFRSGE